MLFLSRKRDVNAILQSGLVLDAGSGQFSYDWEDTWKYYTGIAYDTSPTSAYKRTADITYADYGDARIDNSNGGGHVVGEYRTNRILFFGFSVNW
jgi:hypothetical protein